MCGIFGITSSDVQELGGLNLKSATSSLLRLSESRGKEASGIALSLENDIRVLKRPYRATQLIRSSEYDSLFDTLPTSRGAITLIGHSRLVTNGGRERHENNQPIIADGAVGIHNGIVVNVDPLFQNVPGLERELEVDTEVILDLIQLHRRKGASLIAATRQAFTEIEGVATIAVLFNDIDALLLATNCGSLYYIAEPAHKTLVFASERIILERFLKTEWSKGAPEIHHLEAGQGILIGRKDLALSRFSLGKPSAKEASVKETRLVFRISDTAPEKSSPLAPVRRQKDAQRGLLQYHEDFLREQKRCTTCLLPTTFPFIFYDDKGVCNYCHAYRPLQYKGEAAFREEFKDSPRKSARPDCIVALSGGRDSCFALHYMKKELGLQPLAFTYDWGMVTDLARRNMSRMCAKLGIEHIIVSADIVGKRENIRKNVKAWLKKPHLGTVPLFMAGDKQFFYYANRTMKENGAKKLIFGMNLLEKTDFKTGFCGVIGESHYRLRLKSQLDLLTFYGKQFLSNPAYLNRSLIDSAFAYFSYYMIPHDYYLLFRYLPWNEKMIVDKLRGVYDWEVAPDTASTWRIGDGTTPFYNYIYVLLAGFSESDTFRSNQIREGLITREEGLRITLEENRPRYEAMRWYCETIGIDFTETISRINSLPRLWESVAR